MKCIAVIALLLAAVCLAFADDVPKAEDLKADEQVFLNSYPAYRGYGYAGYPAYYAGAYNYYGGAAAAVPYAYGRAAYAAVPGYNYGYGYVY